MHSENSHATAIPETSVNAADWPVCSVEFEISDALQAELRKLTEGQEPPQTVVGTRFYDGEIAFKFPNPLEDKTVSSTPISNALDAFASSARRLPADEATDEPTAQAKRGELAEWAGRQKSAVAHLDSLRGDAGAKLLEQMRQEANAFSSPFTADILEALVREIEPVLSSAKIPSVEPQLMETIESRLPVFIYFENYGILDSAVYLPRLIEDIARTPNDARIRTITAMFKHVNLTVNEIYELGKEKAVEARGRSEEPTAAEIADDQRRKEARAIKLNSASIDITKRFSEWWQQRRHRIRYDADGDYFRIWVTDDRRPEVEIELESRSKGFQWFFSFYLVFLVESEEGHKDAILLLDEPGIHLHPTAQQELIKFFEALSETNPIAYSTHSPFLIDGEHLHRVRPVTEGDDGRSRVSIETWPADRETIFPLQAAAGYEMMKHLFLKRRNVLAEGLSDYLYIYGLSLLLAAAGRTVLPDDIYVIPCGGTRMVTQIAALFLGEHVRPLVLLDADDQGRIRRDALLKSLYAGQEKAILLLSDALGIEQCEIEDIIGEEILVPVVSSIVGSSLKLNKDDRAVGSLPDQIAAAAARKGVTLPDGWRPEAASRLVIRWAEKDATASSPEMLDRAELVVKAICERVAELAPPLLTTSS